MAQLQQSVTDVDIEKILIYSAILTLIIRIASYSYYHASKEKKKIFLSENYIQAKVYLESGNKTDAVKILRNVILIN